MKQHTIHCYQQQNKSSDSDIATKIVRATTLFELTISDTVTKHNDNNTKKEIPQKIK